LADIHAGHRGTDRLEFTANLAWRVRLEIVHVLVRRATRKVDHEGGLARQPSRRGLRGAETKQVTPGQAREPQCADLQEVASGDAVVARRLLPVPRLNTAPASKPAVADGYCR